VSSTNPLAVAREQLIAQRDSLHAKLSEIEKAISLLEQAHELLNGKLQPGAVSPASINVQAAAEVKATANEVAKPVAGERRPGKVTPAKGRKGPKTSNTPSPRQWFDHGEFGDLVVKVLREAGGKVKTGDLVTRLAKAKRLGSKSDIEEKRFKMAALSQLQVYRARGVIKTVGSATGSEERTWAVAKAAR
jgi:hypothetical protein